GSLADGTRLTQAATVSKNAQWPMFVSLYSGHGCVFGWLSFSNSPDSDLSGDLTWTKPANGSAKFYPAGFTNAAPAVGLAYHKPGSGTNVLGLSEANLVLEGDRLALSMTNQILISTNNRVTNLSSNRLSLSFTSSTGAFKGSVQDPSTLKDIS